jgi:hypothetical protein
VDYSIQARVSPPVRCDWLDVTFPTDSPLGGAVSDLLAGHQCSSRRLSDSVLEFRLPCAEWGNIQLGDSSRGWSRLSASGGSCEALRHVSAFAEYLSLIGSYPHTVTRLDACMDVPLPAPPVISALVSQYPADSLVYLTRKGVRPDYYLKPTPDGGYTGTFYAGPLRSRGLIVTARVYDKSRERLDRVGEDIGPRTRYEVVCRKGSRVTLRDAYDPFPLFWHFAAPALLPLPDGVPAWAPFVGDLWAPGARPVDDYQRLRSRVESSVDLDLLAALADKVTGGRLELLRLLRNRLGLIDVSIA